MTRIALLDASVHRDLTVRDVSGHPYSDLSSMVSIQMSEVADMMLQHPLFLKKDTETGRFGIVAILGFSDTENLFLGRDGWQGFRVPLAIRRGPFHLRQSTDQTGSITLAIDMQDPRVGQAGGQRLFHDDGTSTSFLQSVQAMLRSIPQARRETEAFTTRLAEADLLEPVKVNICLDDGTKAEFQDLYTVDQAALELMPPEATARMHQSGDLRLAHALALSVGQMPALVEWKNSLLRS